MNRLVLVTGTFPYGSGETFLEAEIPYLVGAFDEVIVFPTLIKRGDKDCTRILPEGARVFSGLPPANCTTNIWTCLTKNEVWREITKRCIGRHPLKRIYSCLQFEKRVIESVAASDELIEWVQFGSYDTVLIYSYWLYTIGMAAIKIRDELAERGVRSKVVARTHGFDLYAERAYLGYLPFQEWMLTEMDAVYPCSKQGERYLKAKYPQASSKIEVAYLGTTDIFDGILPMRTETFSIVSCSNVIPIKRVKLIAKALARITNVDVEWTHFGDGELFEDLQYYIAEEMPSSIRVNLRGRVPNGEVLDYYKRHNVNLFVNVSETEGLPVSIMEACSFGIPVIATDVGGTSEIVEDGKNGQLLPASLEIEQLSEVILGFIAMKHGEYHSMCSSSRSIYLSKFSAEKNYPEFCERLLEIAEGT